MEFKYPLSTRVDLFFDASAEQPLQLLTYASQDATLLDQLTTSLSAVKLTKEETLVLLEILVENGEAMREAMTANTPTETP